MVHESKSLIEMSLSRRLTPHLSAIGMSLLISMLISCSNLQVRKSKDGSLESPPPEESPAIVSVGKPSFPIVDPARWSSSEKAQTGLIFAWTIQGSNRLISESGCRLRLRHRESGDTALLNIQAKTPVSIQTLKAGTWDAKRLGCGLTRIWDLEGLFTDGFVVKPDSISVVGWFVFEFDERTLKIVREGGREENTRLASQLQLGWGSMGSQLISGFSGKPLPAKLEVRDEIVRVKATGLKNSDEILRPLLTRFQSCATQGIKVDPLRAGLLKIEATYKAGQFTGAKTGLGENALRDDLIQCILKAHEAFQVSGSGDFVLETTY